MSDVVRLVALRDEPLSVAEVYAAVTDPAAGGVAVFVGTVRDSDSGRSVRQLSYTAHPTAARELQSVAEAVAADEDVIAVAAVHRVGDLDIGDLAVVVAAAAAHRGTALRACERLIDDLKATAPIWKHQVFGDGTEEWVGTP
jgi:molybdopterin synthase catalytic subunit